MEIIKKKRRNTQRKKKLLKLIADNLGNTNPKKKTKTMYALMIEAGFSNGSARQQSGILSGIKEEAKPIVEALIEAREQAIERLKGKINKAKYRDLVDGVDKLTKNIQLLSGKATSRDAFIVSDEEKKKANKALKNIK